MTAPEHNDENIEKLAEFVLGGIDLETLMGMAKETLEQNYRNDPELFQKEWKELIENS